MTNIVFDVGNVLIDWDARLVLRDVMTADEIDPFLQEIGFHAWNLEQDRGRSWADGVADAVARFPEHAALIRRFDVHWHLSVSGPIESSVMALESLHGAGVPLYAITNFSAEKWAECVTRFPFLTLFRDVVVSAHERLVKPDPAIFELFLARNGLSAQDCLFIDDSAANIATADRMGFDTIHLDDPTILPGALRARRLL